MRAEIPKSAKRFFLMVAVALAGGALVGSALAGGNDAEKAEDKKPAPIRWGKAVDGLQIGVACDLNRTPSNRQPTFTVAFKNVGETGLKIPSPLGYSQKRLLKDNWVLYSRPLKLLMIQRVAGQASEKIILGAEKPKASSGIVALKPGETKKYSGIVLMNETVRVKGKQSVPNRRKFILLPSSSCRVAFSFENSQERIGRTKVWTGQADTGEVLVRVEPPELKGKPLTARFELEKAKKPARRRKKPRPNIKNPVAVKYFIGEPICITFAVTNEGDEPLGLRVGSRARREGRHNEFWFEAADVSDVVEDLPYRGGVSMAYEPEQNPILKHGETHERKLLLNKWLLFNKPGKYTIACSRTMVVGENKEPLYLWPARALPTVPFEGEIEVEIVEDEKALSRYVRLLCAALEDKDAHGRAMEEMRMLALSRNKALLKVLNRMVRTPNKFQNAAVTWIGYYGKERAEEALLAAWRSPDVWVRVKALWMLAHFEEKDVEKRVMMAMRSREAPERRAASAMCSSYAYPNCFQKLVAMSKDSDMIVRRNVAGALGSYDDKKAVPVLKMLLYDKSRDMILQVQSARSLAKHGKSDGVSIVIDMLKEKIDSRMRNRVAGALTEMTGEEFGANHEKWSQWWEKNKNNPRALQKDEEE